MASFFDDFKEKKKKKKSLVQTVTPAKAVKAKQETKSKTVSQAAKATVNKNKNFAKAYENKKKVSLPTVTKPSLPKQTMNGSLRTPVRAMGETKKRATQNTAVENFHHLDELIRIAIHKSFHQKLSGLFRSGNHFLCLSGGTGNGLFTQNMLTGF